MKKYLVFLLALTSVISFHALQSQTYAAQRASNVIEINAGNFESEIERSNVPVVLDVYASWCQPCKQLAPIIDELSATLPNVKFAKINMDSNRNVLAKYNIQGLPTIFFFRPGNKSPEVTLTGFKSKGQLEAKIHEFLKD